MKNRALRQLALWSAVLFPAGLATASEPVWKPAPATTWQWQLTGELDLSADVEMFDVDLFTTTAEQVAAIHAKGARAVCYMSAGTFEQWRPDADSFPDSVKGRTLSGWADERWLDIRRLDLLGPILEARLDLCKEKGFDAVEPDNVDAYTNRSGFPLKDEDQLEYNRFVARAAHDRGLSVGLKNDLDQVEQLVDDFDWALNEQCFQYKECEALAPFAYAGKAVFQVEYKLSTAIFCPKANALNFNSIRKGLDLDAGLDACRQRPTPALLDVANAASLTTGGVAPGELAVIGGSGFGPALAMTPQPAPTALELGGTSVLFGETAAEILYLGPDQAIVVVPAGLAVEAQTEVTIVRYQVRSEPITLDILAAHPGLFTADSSGKGQLSATLADSTMNSPSNPAPLGSIVELWGSGFGAAPWPLSVQIGGLEAEVLDAGPAAPETPWRFRIQVRIPAESPIGDQVGVLVTGLGAGTQTEVWLAVAQ